MENKPILGQSFISIDKIIKPSNGGPFGWIKKRHMLAIYAFFGFFFAYSLRANLSVAIVDMSKTNYHKLIADEGLDTLSVYNDSEPWSPVLQGYILSSFFYGYIVTQLPAASLTTKYGGKFFFGAGIGVCSVLSLLMPLSAFLGPGCLIFLRIIQGLAQGFVFPSMHCLWSKWSPPHERSRLATFALSGSYVGSVAALSLGGIIGKHLNWEAIFYFFGIGGLVWTLFWFLNVYESPSHHETIDNDEKLYIESSLSHYETADIPWSIIFRSFPVWAIVFAHFAENWGFYTMLTEMPTFFSDILHFKIDKAGLWSSVPYLLMAKMLYLSGYVSDKLIERKHSYTFVRKMFCICGFIAQSLFMFMMTLISNHSALIVLVTLAIGFGGLPWASFGVNHLDIGARYANVLMSISNTFASLPGIISPILTGHLIQDKEKSDWDAVFGISAGIYLLGAIIFGMFATGETQNWAFRSKDIEIKTCSSTPSSHLNKNESSNVITPPQNSSFSLSESSFNTSITTNPPPPPTLSSTYVSNTDEKK